MAISHYPIAISLGQRPNNFGCKVMTYFGTDKEIVKFFVHNGDICKQPLAYLPKYIYICSRKNEKVS